MKEIREIREIEEKWQKRWKFKLRGNGEKKYVLVMFPYPSGKIHMGHVRNYTIGDAIARYLRMNGYDVLHPIGWDAFGLPAENAAIERKIHPKIWTDENIKYMREQLKKLGISYNWEREISTCSPEYYKWEQKFFIEMWKKGLAYREKAIVNYCPKCETVLANEQVIGDECWRCESKVERREFYSWFLKITKYAEELLQELENLDWPERVKKMQMDWIGKSKGAKIKFKKEDGEEIEIFTTRPDTIFGATFLALSPEYYLKREKRKKKAEEFCRKFIEREERGKEMLGCFTEEYAINPFTGEKIPIWIASYVLPDYGTGAIMAVPAHDQRDFDFAKKYSLPIKVVVKPNYEHDFSKSAYEGAGILQNSGIFSGMDSEKAKEEITKFAKEQGFGDFSISYRLRDWGISRQRYWGTPIPMVYCKKCGIVPEKEENLPILLPYDVEFSGRGNPLDNPKFKNTKCPTCGEPAERETDTMDTFVESSWYFLGYLSGNLEKVDFSHNPFNPELVKRYMPVDIYIGGIEHAVLHLLYARFFTKVLRDLGYINLSEPFKKLITQGMVIKDGAKMSKSKGNIVDPDDVVKNYGADTVRVFILFAAPIEKDLDWSDKGVKGAWRFIQRVYDILSSIPLRKVDEYEAFKENPRTLELQKKFSKIIKAIIKDYEEMKFNTVTAKLMEFLNDLEDFLSKKEEKEFDEKTLEVLNGIKMLYIKALYPIAPHIAEELWEKYERKLIEENGWIDKNKIKEYEEEYVVIPVQVNGKLRGEISVRKSADENEVLKEALKNEKIKKHIKEIKKVIYVPQKILNIVS